MTKYSVIVEEDPETGDAIIQFPDNIMAEVGWQEGDTIDWHDNGDGSYTLTKKEPKEWVLVETVTMFRNRYVCEVPKGKKLWALDTVTCEEAKEFSSEHIGEQIVSHRIVSEEEALKLFDEDNDYMSGWTREKKIETAFTFESDQEFYKKNRESNSKDHRFFAK